MLDITKRYGPVAALESVSLRIEPGQVHGLLGENGAGKTTLMNVLFGLTHAEGGSIRLSGREVRITSPRVAAELGIGMVHQHFKLVPTLTVAENLALVLRSSVRAARGRAKEWLAILPWDVPLERRVESLGVGAQQRVEILKALLPTVSQERGGAGGRTVILDEPTAVLTPQEARELFVAIDKLRKAGHAIVFISHKLAEVQGLCDTVTILRRGKHVHTGPAAELTPAAMSLMMVGAAVEMPTLQRRHEDAPHASTREEALSLEGVSLGKLRDASMRVWAGEIVGIAGVDGNGQEELVRAIIGAQRVERGRIAIGSVDATERSIRWRADRLAYIAEDRQRQAVVLPLSVEQNLILKDYRRPRFSTMGWLRFGAWRDHSRQLMQTYDVRCNSLRDTVGRLSGGNQQKVVLARELHDPDKRLVIAVNPTRGLDVGATAFVMRQLLQARQRGAGVLLVHSDLDELLAISDRVFVLYNGTLTASTWPDDTKEGIGRLMLGLRNESTQSQPDSGGGAQ